MKNSPLKIKDDTGTAYYCVIPIIEKDDDPESVFSSTLGREALTGITERAESYVICADRCVLSNEELRRYHMIFRKIPRDRGLLPFDVRQAVESLYSADEVREWEESEAWNKAFLDEYETFLEGKRMA